MATELASAYLTLVPSLKGAQKQIETQLNGVDVSKAGKKMGGSLSSSLGSAFKTVAKIGVGSIAAVGTAVGGLALGGGISRALKLDQATFKFKALGMDVESAMASCSTAVSGTAFGLDAAATVATQLGAAGVASGDAMTGALKSVAGVAAMSGSSMEDVGAVFSKVAAKGKVGGDELLQLTERGINATAALGKYLGKSSDEVTKMVSSGQVDFATFSAAMEATFGEAASGANATFQGAMGNVMAALSRVGAKFASPALDGLRKVFVAAIPAIDAISVALAPIVKAFTRFTETVSGRAVAGIEAFTSALKDGATPLDALKTSLAATFEGTFIETAARKVTGFIKAVQMGVPPLALLKNYAIELGRSFAKAFDGTKIGGFFGTLMDCFDMGESAASSFRQAFYTLFDGTAFQFIADALEKPFISMPKRLSIALDGVVSVAGEKASAIYDAFASRFPGLASVLSPIVSAVSGFASSVIGRFGAISSQGVVFAGLFAAVMAKFGAPLTAAAKAIAGFGTKAVSSFQLVGGAVHSLGMIFTGAGGGIKGISTLLGVLANPIGIAVAAVAALAAGFVYLMATNEGFRGTITSIVEQIGSSLAPILAIIGEALANLATTVLPLVSSVIGMMLPVIGQIITVVLQLVAALAPVITTLVAVLVPIITQIVQLVVAVASQIISAVLPVISMILTAISANMPTIQAIVTAVMMAVLTVVQAVWPAMQAIITVAMSVIQGVIDTVWPIIQTVITTVMSAIQSVIQIVTSAIKGDWDGVWNGIKDLFSTVWEGIKTAASQGVDAVVKTVTGIKDSILGFFEGAGDWLADAGTAIVQGLIDGITGMIGAAGDAIGSVMDSIAGFLPHSPAKEGAFSGKGWSLYSGRAITDALAEGIADRASAAVSAMSSVMSGVSDSMATRWELDVAPSAYDATAGVSIPAQFSPTSTSSSQGGSIEELVAEVRQLRRTLGKTIADNAPVTVESERDFARRVRRATNA